MNASERDYQRIEKAIHYLNQRFRAQPRLAEVAEHVGLSEFHFQRMFQRWAGVSPKRFLQHLTTRLAKELLRESQSVLDTTFATGLSSPGRLHDLFVSVEAMSPGEHKSGGEGLRIRHGLHPSLFGTCLVASTDRGICGLEFVDAGSEQAAIDRLLQAWPAAAHGADPVGTGRLLDRVFGPGRTNTAEPLKLHLRGTNFQMQVWRALLRIPPGRVASYGALAKRLGRPGASRAVGRAIGQNPVAYLIPCHRVIHATGAVGDYRWGPSRKRVMLMHEQAGS